MAEPTYPIKYVSEPGVTLLKATKAPAAPAPNPGDEVPTEQVQADAPAAPAVQYPLRGRA